MDIPPAIIQYDLTYAERWALDPARLNDAWDHCHAVATLQGIVNRNGPRLYVRAIRQPESGDVNLDDWWLDRLRAKGAWLEDRPIHALPQDIEGLVRRFRDDVKGLVVYDASVPATSNVASTAAGVDRLIAVRYDLRPDSLYSRLRAMGLPVKTWLIHQDGSPMFTGKGTIPDTGEPSSGSAKNDAYRWAAARYLENGRCSTEAMGYYIDAAWLKNPNASTFWNHTLTNHDFFVAKRSFFFDLSPWADEPATDDPGQPLGADLETLQRILDAAAKRNTGKRMMHIGGFIPWAFKYSDLAGSRHEGVPSEWEFVRIISQYNAYLDADALGLCSMANASFYRFQPLPRYPAEKPTVDTARYLDGGTVRPRHYVTFYVGDYDAASWLYQMLPRLWEDPARGSVPLGWAFNPNLAERFPAAFWHTRRTRTPNDVFMAGDSGAGYVNPSLLEEPRPSGQPSGVALWEKHNRKWFRKVGLGITGFVIDGYAPPMPKSVLDAYSRFSPKGTVAQKIPELSLHNGMPLLRMTRDLDHDPKVAAGQVVETLSGEGPTFHIYRAVLKSPSWYRDVVAAIRAARPDVEVVDPYALMDLAKRHLEAHPERAAARPDVAAIYFPGFHQDAHRDGWHGKGFSEYSLLDAAPRFEGHKYLRPAWGAFDESDPAWMEKQVALAADHGIDVFLFDWYWYSGTRIMHRPLEEGFLKAANRKAMKYGLMWANHDWHQWFPAPYAKKAPVLLPIRHTAEDFERAMDHCIRTHFRQPNYWRIYNRVFFSLFDPSEFIRQLGGPAEARYVLEKARKQIWMGGLGDTHFAAFGAAPGSVEAIRDAGFDSITNYNITSAPTLPDRPVEPYEDLVARHEEHWRGVDTGLLPYAPVATVGWDCSPRWAPETPNPPEINAYPFTPIVAGNTPEKFGDLVRRARRHMDGRPHLPYALFVNAWNEWTEGSALLPNTENGIAYLEALKADS